MRQVIIESPRQFGITPHSSGTVNDHTNGLVRNGDTHTNGVHANGNGHVTKKQQSNLLILSAYSTASLDAQVASYRSYLTTTNNKSQSPQPSDVAYTLAHKREHKPYRAYAVTSEEAAAAAIIQPSASQAVPDSPPHVGWVFTGQGAQWAEMGVSLLDTNAVFRGTIQKLDKFLLSLPTPPPWTIEGK